MLPPLLLPLLITLLLLLLLLPMRRRECFGVNALKERHMEWTGHTFVA